MARIELDNVKEMVEKNVSKFRRIDGLKKWSGGKVKVILLSDESEKLEKLEQWNNIAEKMLEEPKEPHGLER